jgi:putative OmpL-like beta-barrel porin-2/carboxypeptidase family protein
MNRRPIVRGIISAGVVVQFALLLCGPPLHAQSGAPASDVPPGMEDPLANGGLSSFTTKPKPEQHVLTADHAPGDVHGVARYPSGLPMAGAQVVILNADVDTERSTISAEDGSFTFKKLKPGHYQMTARIDGYASAGIVGVDVIAGQNVSSDISLKSIRSASMLRSTASEYRTYNGEYHAEPASLRVADPQPATESSTEATVRTAEATTTAAPADAPKTAETPSSQPIPAAVMDELAAMRKRIDELEAALKSRTSADQPAAETPATETPAAAAEPQGAAAATPKLSPGQYLATGGTVTYFKGDTDIPDHPAGFEPFSYADFTWMNANGRQHDSPWSTKYFTPEFRADVNYIDDFNHPRDDTMGGSTESFRSNEWQLEQLSLGGDLRIGHVRGRILTMFGMFATTTPRNDGSTSRGQWDLRNMYRYISEGWGGYHFDVNHGLNVDAGIFVSYIGLFSYYNFDNWTYQPSYVSSNTPWFFNGLRIQWFPTAKLKIEPWIINGWQSYARFNSKPGLGGQILWRPQPWLSFVFNNYGMGTDVLGSPQTSRIHTDDSMELREFNHPDSFLDMGAFSLTGDAGCQYGGGQNCFNDKNGGIKTSFLGWMAYERLQFAHDRYGITLGGGQMNNPGRYLTLLQPINGADAISGSPYFTANLGDKAHMYDATATFDYMPSQWLTFRAEMGYRHADVPYFSGRGGITPPGGLPNSFGNTGSPSLYVCTNGLASAADTTFTPSGAGFYQSSSVTPLGDNLGPSNSGGPVDASCAKQQGAGWYAWAPDLRKSQVNATFAIMTRF